MAKTEAQVRFGRRLRRLREHRGLSQEAFAAAVAKSVDTISAIERGISFTGAEALELMAEVLQVSLGTLFEDGLVDAVELQATPELAEMVKLLRSEDQQVAALALEQAKILLRGIALRSGRREL